MPYIGITDFTSPEEVVRVADLFQRQTRYLLMVGVMSSFKVLRGIPSRWTGIWPAPEKLPEIFIHHDWAYNCIHYADYDGHTTLEDLVKVVRSCGENLRAIQFDMIWPDHMMLSQLKNEFPDLDFVLQVGGKALEQVDNDPAQVLDRLSEYDAYDVLQHVLFDKSMGQGIGLNAAFLRPFLRKVADNSELWLSGVPGLAVAGGLGPSTLHLAEPLLVEFPGLSLDAQSKLRASGNSSKPIDWVLAERYVRAALDMVSREPLST